MFSKFENNELHTNDLKFSRDEVKNIIPLSLQQYLKAEELNKLYNQTDGWIGIIILLIQAYNSNAVVSEHLLNALEINQPVFHFWR